MSQGKYGKDQSFADPVVRCDSCQKILFMKDIRITGGCKHCGNKKVRNVTVFNDEERALMVEMQVDPKFLALFEGAGVSDA
jgi:predicted  nucleic acid-binding Zn-ribbon protein